MASIPRKRRYRGFRHQLIRESLIATFGLCIIAAASFGGNDRSQDNVQSERRLPMKPEQPAMGQDAANGQDYFDGRPIRRQGSLRMRVTAYSPDKRSCGPYADGITASGYSVRTNGGDLVAADTRLLPFGSLLAIPGYARGEVVPVLDRGSAITGSRLDVLFPSHEEAMAWGVRMLEVEVWEYVEEGSSNDLLVQR